MKVTNKKSISNNGFDLLRLLAASQVAFCHSVEFMSPEYASQLWFKFFELFPGVPVFFFVSGFLISRSYEKNSVLGEYGLNRALRIYPALYLCLLVNILLVAFTGYFSTVNAGFVDLLVLFVAKATFFQFYNPDFMRGFGDGVLNGSLWTICVELQFYVMTPIFYMVMSKVTKFRSNLFLIAAIVLFLGSNRLLYFLQPEYALTVYWKLFRVSFVPWFYMFLVGMFFQKNYESIRKRLDVIHPLVLLVLYVGFSSMMSSAGFRLDNGIGPLIYIPLAIVIFRIAFSGFSRLSELLGKNDFSYGIYIYHMPIANMFLFYGLVGSLLYPTAVLLISLLVAGFSWFLLEKPCLKIKRHPANPIVVAAEPLEK